MSGSTPICRVCFKASLEEYIHFETPYEEGPTAIESESIKPLTFLDCYQDCVHLELDFSSRMPQNLCETCAIDLKRAYEFIQRAKKAENTLNRSAAHKLQAKDQGEQSTVWTCTDKEFTVPYEDAEEDEAIVLKHEIEEDRVESPNCSSTRIDVGCEQSSGDEDEIIYGCTYCDNTFHSQHTLNEHAMRDHPDEECATNDSYMKFTDEASQYSVEMIEVVNEADILMTNDELSRTHSDENIELEYLEIDSYEHEMERAGTSTFFYCEKCPSRFFSPELLARHNWRTHKYRLPVERKCKICFNNIAKDLMREHLKAEHSGIVQCSQCDFKCMQLRLPDHERRTHVASQDFLCKICSKTYTSPSVLRQHMKYHERSTVKSDACHICFKKFSTQHYLRQHMEVHAKQRELLQCEQCDKLYVTKSALENHMRMHRGETVVCSTCSKEFARSYELKVHMRFHTGNYPFACEICGKRFAIKGHLRTHMWRHQGLKLQCEDCGKLFTSTKALLEHSYTHTEMPYPCSYCNRGFPSKQKYKVHLKKLHDTELDDLELQKIVKSQEPKPLQRRKLTLVQTDSVIKEVEVVSKDEVDDDDVDEIF